MAQLQLTLRAFRRTKGLTSRDKKIPITIGILKRLKNELCKTSWPEGDKLKIWAAFTTAFFGFLRSSELCAPQPLSFDARSSCLLVDDIQVTSTAASVKIKTSKTDPFGISHTIYFAASGSSLCPVRTLYKHMAGSLRPNHPAFVFTDNTFLTRTKVTSIIQGLLGTSVNSNLLYTLHSFGVGAATSVAAAHAPENIIKLLGRWSSNCYTRHIRPVECSQAEENSLILRIHKSDIPTLHP
eukprot:gene17085-18805_t